MKYFSNSFSKSPFASSLDLGNTVISQAYNLGSLPMGTHTQIT